MITEQPSAILELVHEMKLDFGDAGKHSVQVFYCIEDGGVKLLRIKLFAWDVTKLFDDLVLEDIRFDVQDARWKKDDEHENDKHFKSWRDHA